MAKQVPPASFRQPSTTEMAEFVSRAGSANSPSHLAVVPAATEPAGSPRPSEQAERVTTKAATILIPMPPSSDSAWRSKTVRRVDGRELRKQTFYLDVAVSQRLAQHCAKYHYEQSTAVERAVIALLEACGD